MSKEMLKGLIDLIDEQDTETIFKVLVRFIPTDEPLPDELEAIARANRDIEKHGTLQHDEIGWEYAKEEMTL